MVQFMIKALINRNYKIKFSREGKWIIAEIPGLNLATHGETKEEVMANLKDIVEDYMKDPDTPKPVTKINVNLRHISIPKGVLHRGQTQIPVKA